MFVTGVVQDRFQDYYSRERHRNLLTISLEQPHPCQFINDKLYINIHFNAQKEGGERSQVWDLPLFLKTGKRTRLFNNGFLMLKPTQATAAVQLPLYNIWRRKIERCIPFSAFVSAAVHLIHCIIPKDSIEAPC